MEYTRVLLGLPHIIAIPSQVELEREKIVYDTC